MPTWKHYSLFSVICQKMKNWKTQKVFCLSTQSFPVIKEAPLNWPRWNCAFSESNFFLQKIAQNRNAQQQTRMMSLWKVCKFCFVQKVKLGTENLKCICYVNQLFVLFRNGIVVTGKLLKMSWKQTRVLCNKFLKT